MPLNSPWGMLLLDASDQSIASANQSMVQVYGCEAEAPFSDFFTFQDGVDFQAVIEAVESRIGLTHTGQWRSAALLTLRAYMQAIAFDEYVPIELFDL